MKTPDQAIIELPPTVVRNIVALKSAQMDIQMRINSILETVIATLGIPEGVKYELSDDCSKLLRQDQQGEN